MSNPPADVREAILARLFEIIKDIAGGRRHAFRNRLQIGDELLPAISLLDGDESPDDSGYGRGRPAFAPIVVTMRPEIYGFVEGTGADAGQALSAMRSALLKAILNDATLLGLTKDGDIRYEGFSTGMANGRSLEGEMGLALAFVYLLRPKSL